MSASRKPIGLLLLTDTAIEGPGGSERFLRNLVTGLPPERYRIDVVQLAPALADAQRIPLSAMAHVRSRHLPIGPAYGRAALGVWRQLRSEVLQGRYHLVQSHHEKSDLISALLPRGPQRMLRLSNRRDMGFKKTPRLRQAFRLFNPRFDRILAPSDAILEATVRDENADPARLVCIPNGVDTERFTPLPPIERAAVRASLGFQAHELIVGCVASLSPVKRHVDLITAFAQVHARCPLARLVLVGDGPLRAEVEAQIAALGLQDIVHLLGARGDAHRLWAAMDVAVLVSSTEGLSNALLEAQACGVPAVATAVGGNPDVVQEGATGRLVPPHAPQALAAALLDALEQPAWRERAGRAARLRATANWSIAAMVTSYDRLYQSLHTGAMASAHGADLMAMDR
jgi:glycosyltransferase involved in cell wall biosynthesis